MPIMESLEVAMRRHRTPSSSVIQYRLQSSLFWLRPSSILQLPWVRNHPDHESESRKTELLKWPEDF